VPSPDPSAETVLRVRAVRVADEDAGFRRVDVDVTATFGFAAAAEAAVDVAEAGFAEAGVAVIDFAAAGLAAGFARAFERAGDAALEEAFAVDRAPDAGLSSLIRAVSWTTSARASDACFFRFASTSRAFWRRFSSRANSFPVSLAARLTPAVPAD
jgi:hypothetical protein